MSFSDKSALTRHMQTHTPRIYKCSFENCNKTYKSKSSLDYHMRLHTEVDPYRCPEKGCGKTFTSPKSLARHQKMWHATDPDITPAEQKIREKIITLHKRSNVG